MTSEELIAQLNILNIHPSSYSLGTLKNNDCTCVVKEKGQWTVYYVERDQPSILSSFLTEEEAYDFILEQFKKWLS
ncbi:MULTISPECIES: hypothetical protein [Photorhabdus]|uniref:hypothetical protein n=1 Tax=Photorhabdus TaxID=29487 RepID=UPI000DCEA3F5|nr:MULTISPECIES: hypothetical protein [Photorhabdus]MCT8343382.1 hypothetical protein [Photorhabdus kleinii]RAW97262.1 hypothetical protein CKY05_13880 [Photorhabdus sp. S10-54]RAW97628.1 hypothetical protein CKY03_12965 [Photorhabdus sp. S9-53]RAX01737.1 hypothetical protein CKY04_13530 [Photorhabdus sp. S8-52]